MHPNLADVMARLDHSRAAVRASLERIYEAERARRPADGRWSVDEVLEHLSLVNRRFDRVVGAAISRAMQAGLGSEQAPRVPLADAVGRSTADRTDRRSSPEDSVPTGTIHGSVAVEAWERAHEGLRATLAAADGLALGEVVAEHRRWGPLTVYQWAEVCAGHEARHAEQIDEIAAQIAGRHGA